MGILDNIQDTFRKGSNLTKLIYINVAVFILITVLAGIGFLFSNPEIPDKVVDLLAVPSSLKSLLTRPWTPITYMFLHQGIWHILFNMLWLYWFGTIFLQYLDQRKLVAVYILGGLAGAVVYILSFNVFPVFEEVVSKSVALGASASVMAVVIAISVYVPDYTIHMFLLGRIKIKYMALAIFILSSVMDFSSNSGGKLAHIGGAILGYFFTVNLKQGKDIGKGVNRIIDFLATIFKPRQKLKVTYKKKVVNEYEYNKSKAEHQKRINQILEKISKAGYDSLTKEEKEILFRESQNRN